MPVKAWFSYGRNLPKIEAAERLATLQTFHSANPKRYAERLRAALKLPARRAGRDVDTQLARMAGDSRYKDAVKLERRVRKKK